MSANPLVHKSAPGETRTPNLLIRSQSLGSGRTGPTGKIEQGSDTEPTVYDTGSHNNSHNIPDPYASSLIFTVWKWVA